MPITIKRLLRTRKSRKQVATADRDKKQIAQDSFPEIKSLPEYNNGGLLYKDEVKGIAKIRDEKYDTKEDQDVAVFMAFADRMNIDSLLFILQGHARELNFPSADFLLSNNAAKIKEKRASAKIEAVTRVTKKFAWAEDDEGNVLTETNEVESIKIYKDLWWQEEEMHSILTGVLKDVRYYQQNRRTYISAVEALATQKDNRQTEANMKTVINDRHARGLEVHTVGYLENLRQDYINAILDEQDSCEEEDAGYDAMCEQLRKRSMEFSCQSQSFAVKLAKCDHIVALKASLSKWEPPRTTRPAVRRCGSDLSQSSDGYSATQI